MILLICKKGDNMIFDILGWIGMIMLLVSYILLSNNKIKNGYLYQIINLLAAIFMGIGLYPKKAWFSFTLEIAWGLIAIITIIKLKNKENK